MCPESRAKQCLILIKYYLARDSGFKIQTGNYENVFQKKVPDFRKSKYVFTIVLL